MRPTESRQSSVIYLVCQVSGFPVGLVPEGAFPSRGTEGRGSANQNSKAHPAECWQSSIIDIGCGRMGSSIPCGLNSCPSRKAISQLGHGVCEEKIERRTGAGLIRAPQHTHQNVGRVQSLA